MLLELCVTELEDVAADKQAVRGVSQPVVQESPHPYTDDMSLTGVARVPGMLVTVYADVMFFLTFKNNNTLSLSTFRCQLKHFFLQTSCRCINYCCYCCYITLPAIRARSTLFTVNVLYK